MAWFQNAQDPLRKAIYQKVAQGAKFLHMEDGMARVQQGLFAFHVPRTTAYSIIAKQFQENEKCDLKELDFYHMFDPYLTIRKNSPYKELFSSG